MPESKVGDEFVTHEFDEAIAVQRGIVDAETALAKSHPHSESRTAIAAILKDDKGFLKELERLGRQKGATGKVEDVAEGLTELLESMVEKAGEAPSEAYEAHAVLLNAKRKQQDSAGGMLRIARALKDTEARDAAQAFEKAQKASSDQLAGLLADFAVVIATAETKAQAMEPRGGGTRASR
ncbi:MAG: hypothetical protein ABWZ82_00100 [Candidatus Limnocylindrales bacterium]